MELRVVAEQLDVARLQHQVQAQLVAQRQRIVQPQRLVLLLCHPGHVRVPLRKPVVCGSVWGTEEALHAAVCMSGLNGGWSKTGVGCSMSLRARALCSHKALYCFSVLGTSECLLASLWYVAVLGEIRKPCTQPTSLLNVLRFTKC